MIYFVEEIHKEWQQKSDYVRLNSGRHHSTSNLIFSAMLVFWRLGVFTPLGVKDSIFPNLTLRRFWQLNLLVNDQLSRSKLEQKFEDRIHEETLKPLLSVIQGLMRFMPSDRISTSHAVGMISSRWHIYQGRRGKIGMNY